MRNKNLKGLYKIFQMTFHAEIVMSDSQRYPEILINYVEDIVVYLGLKELISDNFVRVSCSVEMIMITLYKKISVEISHMIM